MADDTPGTHQPTPPPASASPRGAQELKVRLADALNAIVPFEDQDPDEQFYPARCGQGKHYWHENACHEGDTCNCGDWYRFADRIEETT